IRWPALPPRKNRAASTAAPSGRAWVSLTTFFDLEKARRIGAHFWHGHGLHRPTMSSVTVAGPRHCPYISPTFRSYLMIPSFAQGAKHRGDFAMASAAPLMPKATAVWLLDNTALSFDQIAEFCELHPLEVKAIADGDAAQGIKGLDPILTGQLTREQIEEAEKNPESRLKLTEPKVAVSTSERAKKGPRYTPFRAVRIGRTPSCGWCATTRNSKTAPSCGWWAPPSRPLRRSAIARTGTRPT